MSNIQTTKKTVSSILDSPTVQEKLQKILGKNASVFATSVVQIANSDKRLANAEPNSIVGAAMVAATLNLPLNNAIGHAYIAPFKEKQQDGSYLTKAQFMIGYKGIRQLAIRSNQYKHIYAKEIFEGQKIDDESFVGYHFEWDKKISDKIIGYASYFKLLNGFESVYFMSISDLQKHGKKYSQTFKKGFGQWKDDFHKMCLKTVSKLHLSGGEAPMSIELQNIIKYDQSIVDAENMEDVKYSDNEPEYPHNYEEERIHKKIDECKTHEDLEAIRPYISEKYLPKFKKKIKEINQNKK